MNKILIIGFGKLGSHLYYSLKSTGKYKVTFAKKRNKKSILDGLIRSADVIFICVQDSIITKTAESIIKLNVPLKNKTIFHTSGALTSDAIKVLKQHGTYTGSFHPVQSFAKRTTRLTDSFNKIYIATEGDKPAVKKAYSIAKSIGSIPFTIKKENKVYHHICCVMASNFLSALNGRIEETGRKKIQINGFNNLTFLNIYMPLAKQTLGNIAVHGAKGSLTGPIERNDVTTVKHHLEALKKSSKELLTFYILMGIETVKLALNKKSITKKQSSDLYKLFSNYIIKQ
ncbi:MAG: DUF2520 domain-containing protein [Ignavibacteria bacterium]|nr:DUF2520 domain-containing protein [Ignavibacteria bacterium]